MTFAVERRARLVSLATGVFAFALCVPLLATAPLNGDGLELVGAVASGGALHPPGFPLQALLDRVFAQLPLFTIAWRLSLLAAVAHGVAVVCVAEAAGLLAPTQDRARFAPRVVAGVVFALSPAWALAVQPEVFAVAHALLAALVLFAVATSPSPSSSPSSSSSSLAPAATLGALVGAAAASHPITILAAPFFLLAMGRLLQRSRRRGPTFVVAAVSFVVVVVALYATLTVSARTPWPGWGELRSLNDVFGHALRFDYGGALSMSSIKGGATTSALDVLFHEARAQPLVAVIVVAAALRGLYAAYATAQTTALAAALASALALLVAAKASVPAPYDEATAVVERMLGPLWVMVALLTGAGVGAVVERLSRRVVVAAALAGAAAAASVAVVQAPLIDASADHTLDVAARATAASLPPQALYVVAEDVDCMGVVVVDGAARAPVCVGLLGLPWYTHRLAATEPRLPAATAVAGVGAIVAWARGAGIVVASPHDELLAGAGPLSFRGPLVLVGVDAAAANDAAVAAAVAVCPLIAELEPLPGGRHAFTEGAWQNLARGFDAAAFALGSSAAAAEARGVAEGLRAGLDPATWRNGCDRFAAALAPNAPKKKEE